MIAFLKGTILDKNTTNVIVEVNNIGYDVMVSTNTLSNVGNVGDKISLYTYMQVKEDGIILFGFMTKEEKSLFLSLITVSGIGGKTALAILSGAPINDLMISIINKDVGLLSKVKGIGKKSAERIILELSEKLSDGAIICQSSTVTNFDVIQDAVGALTSLGVNRTEASRLARVYAEKGDSAEDLITKILQGLGR